MFKKFSSATLIIILIVLLGVYVVVRYAGSGERTFRDKVVSFDPASITQVNIYNPGESTPTGLKLFGNKWMVGKDGREYTADSAMVGGLLRQLSDLPTKRYAGKGQDAWKKYELTDSLAIEVVLNTEQKTVANLLIGKFEYTMPKGNQQNPQFRQQQGDMTSFVRLKGEKDVYAVDGFLKMYFNRGAESFRLRKLTGVNPNDISRVTILSGGSQTVLEAGNGTWTLDGLPADSATAARYCAGIARLNGSKFVDQGAFSGIPSHKLTIEGNNFNPIELSAYPVADTNIQFVVTSSLNPGAYFNGKDGGLFSKIWENQEELMNK